MHASAIRIEAVFQQRSDLEPFDPNVRNPAAEVPPLMALSVASIEHCGVPLLGSVGDPRSRGAAPLHRHYTVWPGVQPRPNDDRVARTRGVCRPLDGPKRSNGAAAIAIGSRRGHVEASWL